MKMFLILLFFITSMFAQILNGIVVSPSGSPIYKARVTSELETVLTKKNGTFKINAVSNKLSFRAKGYRRKSIKFKNNSSVILRKYTTKALYVSMGAIKNKKRLRQILNIATRTQINTLVVDVKIAKGYLTFKGNNKLAKAIGAYRCSAKVSPKKFVKFLKKYGVYLIARFSVFKDDLLARKKPSLAIRKNRKIFRDRDKLWWVNPYKSFVQNYNISLIKEIAKYGFDEIQLDYIRFPACNGLNYGHKNNQRERVKTLNKFLAKVKHTLIPYNIFLAINTFGAACWAKNDLGIGHNNKALKKHVDYISPMLYPSGFTYGIPGLRNPTKNTYKVVKNSLKSSMRKHGLKPKDFKPWLQAFDDYAFGRKRFGQRELNNQIRACEQLGTSGWLLWNASSNYSKYFSHYKKRKKRKKRRVRK